MKTRILFSLLLLSPLLFSGCHKDKTKPKPTIAQLLIGKWMITDIEGETLTNCDKKSYFLLNKDSSFIYVTFYTESGNCTSHTLLTGTYTLSSDNTKIIVTNGYSITTIPIISIDKTTLILSFDGQDATLKKP